MPDNPLDPDQVAQKQAASQGAQNQAKANQGPSQGGAESAVPKSKPQEERVDPDLKNKEKKQEAAKPQGPEAPKVADADPAAQVGAELGKLFGTVDQGVHAAKQKLGKKNKASDQEEKSDNKEKPKAPEKKGGPKKAAQDEPDPVAKLITDFFKNLLLGLGKKGQRQIGSLLKQQPKAEGPESGEGLDSNSKAKAPKPKPEGGGSNQPDPNMSPQSKDFISTMAFKLNAKSDSGKYKGANTSSQSKNTGAGAQVGGMAGEQVGAAKGGPVGAAVGKKIGAQAGTQAEQKAGSGAKSGALQQSGPPNPGKPGGNFLTQFVNVLTEALSPTKPAPGSSPRPDPEQSQGQVPKKPKLN